MIRQPDWESAAQYALGRLRELPSDLAYHGIHHTLDDVLPAAERLARLAGINGEQLDLLRTATLYHDVGYLEQYFRNEPIGVRIAMETLPGLGFSPGQIQVIEGLIMATQLPQTPHTLLEDMMSDADLDSLGRDDYFVTSHNLWAELKAHDVALTLPAWYERQINFLGQHTYFTPFAHSLREAGKQRNLAELKKRWAEGVT